MCGYGIIADGGSVTMVIVFLGTVAGIVAGGVKSFR